MLRDEQIQIFTELVATEKDLLYTKGTEYANDVDVLANFKRGSKLGITSKQKLGVYLEKHLAAIESYIANGYVSSESIESRIQDARNYLFLLLCLHSEEQNGH